MSNTPFVITLAPSAQLTAEKVLEQISAGRTKAQFCASYATAGDTFFAFVIVDIAQSGLVDMVDGDTFKAARKAWAETYSSNSKDSCRAYATEALSLSRRMSENNLDWSQVGSMRDLRTIARYKAPKDVTSTGEACEHEAKAQAEAEAVRQAVEAKAEAERQAEAARQQAEALAEAEAVQAIYLRKLGDAEAERDRLRETYATAEASAINAIEALKAELNSLKAENEALKAELNSLKAKKQRRA